MTFGSRSSKADAAGLNRLGALLPYNHENILGVSVRHVLPNGNIWGSGNWRLTR